MIRVMTEDEMNCISGALSDSRLAFARLMTTALKDGHDSVFEYLDKEVAAIDNLTALFANRIFFVGDADALGECFLKQPDDMLAVVDTGNETTPPVTYDAVAQGT